MCDGGGRRGGERDPTRDMLEQAATRCVLTLPRCMLTLPRCVLTLLRCVLTLPSLDKTREMLRDNSRDEVSSALEQFADAVLQQLGPSFLERVEQDVLEQKYVPGAERAAAARGGGLTLNTVVEAGDAGEGDADDGAGEAAAAAAAAIASMASPGAGRGGGRVGFAVPASPR
jgi:hypothetical protein